MLGMHGRIITGRLITWICLLAMIVPAPRSWAQEWLIHKVKRGQNLTVIAHRHDVTVQEIRDWNKLRSDELAIGQRLRIPRKDTELYIVRLGDTLTDIADRNDLPLSLLRKLNGITGSRIYVGQQLKLQPTPLDEAVHVVRRGESLTEIGRQFGLTVAELKRINDLTGNRIFVGQKLRLRDAGKTVHIVESGDALWEIAQGYGISVTELKRLNNMKSDRIYPGQELRLSAAAAKRTSVYKVNKGDNLTEIARLHQMSLRELRDLNGISGSVIHPGQNLRVRPMPGLGGKASSRQTASGLDWSVVNVPVRGVYRIQAANGPYYYEAPKAKYQKHSNYFEESSISPPVAYRHARLLWESFEKEVAGMGRVGNRLAGWHFVLDPGHGGIDPGTTVRAKDSEGKTFTIVEDEYVYDIALRVYVLLKLNGADVTLTLLSPNHLLRQNSPASRTFVHDRNEVINSASWNKRDRPEAWPKGNQKHLDARVNVAKRAFKGVPKNRQVFLSFHADNVPALGEAVSLLYFKNRHGTDTVSRELARKLLPALGAGARMKGQNLGVLRTNPAQYKLLVELRNLAYEDHIWAIRYDKLRQRDAEKVVKALLDELGG
ncbi:MAG: LysM peptidoglycan-binding domain-containing protein [Candidatus Krumholzibacteriota bacterium]